MSASLRTSLLLKPFGFAALALAMAAFSAPAQAQQPWPSRQITFVVSQAAGASPDIMARLFTDRLAAHLKVPVIVENKPGAGNVIGARAVARSAPDGYTFFFATSASLSMNPFLMKDLGYDPIKDFVPVAFITRSHQVLVANPDLPVNNIAELVALEKKSPGKLSIAVDGPRNLAGVVARMLNDRAGLNLTFVPYPNINAGLTDTASGRVQLGIFSLSVAEPFIREGKLRAIAGTAESPIGTLPGLPTVAGTFPGFDYLGWFMLMAPANTPNEIIVKMNAAMEAVAADEKIREMAPKLGFEMSSPLGDPQRADNFLKAQLSLWERTTKGLGFQAE